MSGENHGQIYLITDFGEGPYTGILKALIKSINSGLEVYDIDNTVPSFKITAGAYILANTYYWTPKGSIIVAVVDPGVGTSREAVLVEAGDYVFVGPNNGILYPAVQREKFKRGVSLIPARVVEAAASRFKGKLPEGKWPLSNTFHARDVFAPAAALYASGVDMELLGTPIEEAKLKRLILERVEEVEEGYRLKVVYVDKFGNVALSARQGVLAINSWQRVMVSTEAGSIPAVVGRKFEDAQTGELVLYVNSFGYLEIAVNQGNAARRLRVDVGDPVVITPIE